MFRLLQHLGRMSLVRGDATLTRAEVEQGLAAAKQHRGELKEALLKLEQQKGQADQAVVQELHKLYVTLDEEIAATVDALAVWSGEAPVGRKVRGTGQLKKGGN